ncbi:MAG: hypothetical protein ABII64_02865 [Elusimicrobiota bacterium]
MDIDNFIKLFQTADQDEVRPRIQQNTKILFDNIVLNLQRIGAAIQEKTNHRLQLSIVNVNKPAYRAKLRIDNISLLINTTSKVAQQSEENKTLCGRLSIYFQTPKVSTMIFDAFVYENSRYFARSCIGSLSESISNDQATEKIMVGILNSVIFEGKSFWDNSDAAKSIPTNRFNEESNDTTFIDPEYLLGP